MHLFQIIVFSLFFNGIACARTPAKDQGLSAVEGGDMTAIIGVEGCGNGGRLIPGFAYCRKTEGDPTSEKLIFVGPRTNCKRDSCVEFKVFPPDGSEPIGDAIPKNQFRKEWTWEKLLRRKTFEISDRGFWLFTYRVYWLDKDGNENVSVSEGEIRLRVLKKNYLPLNDVEKDSNFAWDFSTREGQRVKITTGMRAWVSP